LPAGSIGFRAAPAKLLITDETALLRWTKENLLDALQVQVSAVGTEAKRVLDWQHEAGLDGRVAESVSKRLVNTHAGSTGEIPAGTVVEPAHDELHIR
jgi:hypothetical protein